LRSKTSPRKGNGKIIMRNHLYVLFVLFLLSGCDNPDFGIDREMRLKEGTPFIYSSFLEHKITKINGGVASAQQQSDANYYFQYDSLSDRQFIIQCLHLDCNERMDSIKWDKSGEYFTFHITESSRYLSGNRLVLFKTSNKLAKRLIDIRDRNISDYFFENDLFYFVYADTNDTVSIKL